NEGDTEVRATLVDTLNELAQVGHAAEVLALLGEWAAHPDAKAWVITRTLSRTWAAEQPEQALAILRQLTIDKGPKRKVRNAIQALAQHGAADYVDTQLEAWADDPEPNVKALIRDMNGSALNTTS
ncbi:MAG: hypothetical protein JXB38_02710, partial [Anaerolineales bacterium]|nr:hypothetical protein [Anaerolineales bacterium]